MVQHSLKALAAFLLLSGAAFAAQNAAMRPGLTRDVSGTLTTDSAGFADLGGQVSWTSTAAAPKTETLPACVNTIQGLPITIVDGAGTAATYPITVNAASGTVGGNAAGIPITGNSQGLLFNCDAPNSNWVIAGVSPGAGAITWPNLNGETTCTITGTGSPKVFTPICANNYITIDGTGETINVPSNMPANPLPPPGTPNASNATASYALFITYTGAFTPGFGAGTQWQNKTAPGACGGSVTSNCLSSVSGAPDLIIGKSLGSSSIVYGAVITNYGVPVTKGVVSGGVIGNFVSSAANSYSLNISAAVGQSLACYFVGTTGGLNPFVSAAVTFADSSTAPMTNAVINVATVGTNGKASTFYIVNVAKAVSSVNVTLTGSPGSLQVFCDVLTGVTSAVSGGQALAVSNNSSTSPYSTASVTSVSGGVTWSPNVSTANAVTLNAGSGFILSLHDTSGTAWNAATEWRLSPGTTDQGTWTNSSATSTSNAPGIITFQ